VLGVLVLVNARVSGTGRTVPFGDEAERFIEALASQAAVAADNQNLMQAHARPFDSIIQVLAGAIDTKSPYTGGHCARVPQLGAMLAKATCECECEGCWRSFRAQGADNVCSRNLYKVWPYGGLRRKRPETSDPVTERALLDVVRAAKTRLAQPASAPVRDLVAPVRALFFVVAPLLIRHGLPPSRDDGREWHEKWLAGRSGLFGAYVNALTHESFAG